MQNRIGDVIVLADLGLLLLWNMKNTEKSLPVDAYLNEHKR